MLGRTSPHIHFMQPLGCFAKQCAMYNRVLMSKRQGVLRS